MAGKTRLDSTFKPLLVFTNLILFCLIHKIHPLKLLFFQFTFNLILSFVHYFIIAKPFSVNIPIPKRKYLRIDTITSNKT